MQAGLDYADVRIPLDRPDLTGAGCLADLSAEALFSLAQAEGFAGHVTLDGETCTWHREINWHGTPQALDVGAISFDDAGRMIEAGVIADYTELWEQRAQTPPRCLRVSDGIYTGVLMLSNNSAVLGLGRAAKRATQPLVNKLQSGRVPDCVDGLFDGLHAVCRSDGTRLIATLATNPFVEGLPVLTLQNTSVIWQHVGFDGASSDIELQIEPVEA